MGKKERVESIERECAPEELIKNTEMKIQEIQDFSRNSEKEGVYKEVPDPREEAQSRSTDSRSSRGSSDRVVTSGPEDSSTSYRDTCASPCPSL